MTATDRMFLAKQVGYSAQESATAGIRAAGNALVTSASASKRTWKSSADKFTALYKKRGWRGLSADDRKLRKIITDVGKSDGSGLDYGSGNGSSGRGSKGGSRRPREFW